MDIQRPFEGSGGESSGLSRGETVSWDAGEEDKGEKGDGNHPGRKVKDVSPKKEEWSRRRRGVATLFSAGAFSKEGFGRRACFSLECIVNWRKSL